MGGLVSGITDALGLTNVAGEQKAAQAAASASAAGTALSKEQIAFAKDQLNFQKTQYQDWQNIYGDVEKNVGNYYNNLTPDKLETLGLQNQQQQFQQVQKETQAEFAQRGLSGSGVEATTLANNAFANANQKANIRTNAPEVTAQQKEQFIGIGLGQGTAELGNIANSANTVNNSFSTGVGMHTNIASSYLNQATSMNNANIQSMDSLVGMVKYSPAGPVSFGGA